MVEESWNQAIETQHCQQVSAGALVSTPSVCQILCSPFPKIDWQTSVAVSFGFWLLLHNQTYDISNNPQCMMVHLIVRTIPEQLSEGAR